MEPRIHYAQSEDGVSIAYWTLGNGEPFVYSPVMPFSHIQLEWGIPECRRWYERLASGRQLVRFDGRGSGLSDRDASDFMLDAQLRDLSGGAGPVKITFLSPRAGVPLSCSHFGQVHVDR